MTPQEEQLLDGLIGRVLQTRPAGKDTEAEERLQQALGSDPDALYVLAQTVLVQQYALEQAQKQLAEVRQQVEEMKARQVAAPPAEQHTSFLGNLFGSHSAPPPPPAPVQQSQYAPVYGSGQAPPPGYGQPGYGQVQYVPVQPGGFGGGGFGGGGGFLQGAMQTAAGVVAGEMAFRGIEDLMHGFGHEAGYGSDRMMGGMGNQPEVINNYYGGEAPSHGSAGDSFGDRLQAADGGSGMSADVEDRRGFLGSDDSNAADQFADSGDSGSDDSLTGGDSDSSFGDSGSNDDFGDNGSSDDFSS